MDKYAAKRQRFQEIMTQYEDQWDRAKQELKTLLQEGIAKNDMYLIASANYWLGVAHFRAGDKGELLSYALKGAAFFAESDDYLMAARSYNLLAVVYTLSEEYLLAIDTYQKAYDILIKHPCKEFKITSILMNFAANFFRMGDLKNAIEYAERCREELKEGDTEHDRILFIIGENLSCYYEADGQYEKALERAAIMKEAMDRGKCLPEDESCYYVRLSSIAFATDKTEKGIAYADKVIAIGNVGVGEHEPQDDYERIALSLIRMQDYKRAAVFIGYLKDYCGQTDIVTDKLIYYRSKAAYFEATGDEKEVLICFRALKECYETQKKESLATERLIQKQLNDTMEDIKELTRKVKENEKGALTDSLTGLFNKSGVQKYVPSFCKNGKGLLVILDLDSFKLINDIYGHQAGDDVLKEFAHILTKRCEETDILCRVGGDEFLACIQNDLEEKIISSFVDYLNVHIKCACKELLGEDFDIPIGVSAGVVQVPAGGEEYSALFAMADKALYQVKQNGKHGYSLYHKDTYDRKDAEKDPEEEINRMVTIWKERGTPHGAMVVGQDVFSWIYRYMIRFSSRYDFHISICMLILKKAEGIEDDAFSDAFYRFEKYLHDHLRKNDLVLNGQHNTIYLMLPDLPGQNTKAFMDRVMEEWRANPADQALDISCYFKTQ